MGPSQIYTYKRYASHPSQKDTSYLHLQYIKGLGRILLPPVAVNNRYADPLKLRRRCKHHWRVTTNKDTLMLKQFPLFLSGISFDYFYSIRDHYHNTDWDGTRTKYPTNVIWSFWESRQLTNGADSSNLFRIRPDDNNNAEVGVVDENFFDDVGGIASLTSFRLRETRGTKELEHNMSHANKVSQTRPLRPYMSVGPLNDLMIIHRK